MGGSRRDMPPRIAVVAEKKVPSIEYYIPQDMPADNRVGRAAMSGMKKGAQAGEIAGVVTTLALVPFTAGFSLIFIREFAAVGTLGGAAVGTVAGATQGAASGKLKDEPPLAGPALTSTFDQSLAESIVAAGRTLTNAEVEILDIDAIDADSRVAKGASARFPSATTSLADFARARGFTEMIEVGIARVGIEAHAGPKYKKYLPDTPSVVLFIVGHGRLTDLASGRSTLQDYAYRVAAHVSFAAPTVEAAWLERQLADASVVLSERIAEDFLLKPLGTDSIHEGVCGLAPLPPAPASGSSIAWEPFDAMNHSVSASGSLQPTLAWESFSAAVYDRWSRKPQAGIPVDVVYDLRIWQSRGGDAPTLSYERTGLAEPTHVLETALSPGATYFWEVRARFTVNGERRATIWNYTSSQEKNNKHAPYTRFSGRERSACQSYFIPERGRFRFTTPGAAMTTQQVETLPPPFSVVDTRRQERPSALIGRVPIANPDIAAAAPPPTPAAASSGQLRVLDQWKYRMSDGRRAVGTVVVQIHAINGGMVREHIKREQAAGFVVERDVDTTFQPTRFLDPVVLPGGYELVEFSPYLLPSARIESGQAWKNVPGKFQISGVGRRKLLSKVRVIGQEDVVVPAGTFHAWKVEADVEELTVTQGHRVKMKCTFWYAPESLRAVKMTIAARSSMFGEHPTLEMYELAAMANSP